MVKSYMELKEKHFLLLNEFRVLAEKLDSEREASDYIDHLLEELDFSKGQLESIADYISRDEFFSLISAYLNGKMKETGVYVLSNTLSVTVISIEIGINDQAFGYFHEGEEKVFFLSAITQDSNQVEENEFVFCIGELIIPTRAVVRLG